MERFREAPPFTFDAVLLDMQMPVMDGCEAARQIRALQRPDAGTVPIIAVTANAFAEDVAATTEAGMNAHIAKPIELAALQRGPRRDPPGAMNRLWAASGEERLYAAPLCFPARKSSAAPCWSGRNCDIIDKI